MAENEPSSAPNAESPANNGDENFSEDIKDYAKTTMNELLGMFGYDDEMTSESVSSLDIKVPDSMKDTNSTTPNPVTTTSALGGPVDPVIVSVEGSTTVSGVVRKHGEGVAVSTAISHSATTAASTAPTDDRKTEPALDVDKTVISATDTAPVPSDAKTAKEEHPSSSKKHWTEYLHIIEGKSGKVAKPCTWCKKITIQQDYSFKDGKRVLECRSICSKSCFQKAALSITVDNDHIKSVQKLLREELPEESSTTADARPGPSTATGIGDNSPPTSFVTLPRGLAPGIAPFVPRSMSSSIRQRALAPAPIGQPFAPQAPAPRYTFPPFNWDQYLARTRSEAAHWSFFRQTPAPPYNGFKVGMKLEVTDPRIVDTVCVGTVVGVLGSRIRVRFDGTDASNDVWHVVDSNEIHPCGWCEKNGGMLQPPMGFKSDPGNYHKFISKSLADAELAPGRLFKKEPPAPERNFFQKGMKLEATDPKNHALICVASVGDVQGDKIRIDFDGYLGSDYWARFDSRSIFPARWCNFTGHPLQPPGNSKRAQKALSQSIKAKEEKKDKKEKSEKEMKKSTKSSQSTPSPASSPDPSSSADSSYSPSDSAASSDDEEEEEEEEEKEKEEKPKPEPELAPPLPTVQVCINRGCYVGEYLHQQKVLNLPSSYQGKVVHVVRQVIQSIVDCALDQKVVFDFLKPGNGRATIYARSNKQVMSCVLQHVDRVSIFWRVLERFISDLKCCENLVADHRVTNTCGKCKRRAYKPDILKRAQDSQATSSIKTSTVKRVRLEEPAVSSPNVGSTSPAKTWSVDEVVKYIEKTELAEHIPLFRQHEIDGRALLLLTRQIIMSYMGLKLGPAIKLLDLVNDLKASTTNA